MKRRIPTFTVLLSLFSFLLGLVGNVVASWITDIKKAEVTSPFLGVVAILAVLLIIIILIWYRQPRYVKSVMQPPITLKQNAKGELVEPLSMYAKEGLIAFVSLYKRVRGEPLSPLLTPDELLNQANDGIYANLDLMNSNLQPVIEAVSIHKSTLHRCWLIGTKESMPYAPALIAYLRTERGLKCEFVRKSPIAVEKVSESIVTTQTRDLINTIFDEAEKSKISNKAIVSDFSGCPRSMALGMFLACMDTQRDIQFVATEYDNTSGVPSGELKPIIFGYEPVLASEK